MVDISPEKNGGILKEIKVEGSKDPIDKPFKGDTVYVHYVGTLEDGSKFDSSRDRGQKFKFTLGKGEVIKGWDVGVASMSKGEVAVFTITAEFGYGDTGSPPKIPGGATLIFEVELFEFHGEDITKAADKGVIKRTVESGEGLDHPNEESLVQIGLKGYHGSDLVLFDERELSFSLGEGQEAGLPSGVELALEKMKKKETARVSLTPAYGFGSTGVPDKKVPAQANLTYEITLKSFERSKESWQMDGEQKLEQAKILKEKGTTFFKAAKFTLAGKKYKKIIEFLEHEISLKGEQETERRALLQAGRLNLAMCYLKSEEWIEARNICDKVIEENESSEKAYFRRGEAQYRLNDHEEAKKDFQRVLDLDPENKAAKNKIAVCGAAIKKQKQQEAKTYANMFEKFARIDEKKESDRRGREKPMEINEWEKERNEANAAKMEVDAADTNGSSGDSNNQEN